MSTKAQKDNFQMLAYNNANMWSVNTESPQQKPTSGKGSNTPTFSDKQTK